MSRIPLLRLGLVASSLIAAACSSPFVPEGPGSEEVGTAAAALTAADAISRAEEWVVAKLLYCQSPDGASDTIDPACPAVCTRTSNPAWDPYRSDCSGLVSWAWGLPAPGRTTAEFAPNQTDLTSVIRAGSLQMGDAVNTDDATSSDHHVMLFKEWTVPGQTATFIEEPGCSANPNYAHEFTSNVTIDGTSITVAYNGMTFQAIRYGALGSSSSSSSGSSPPSCTVGGVSGVCIDTSACAAMPGRVSIPGHCPGPASEQCCTPTGSASGSSSTSSTSGGATSGGAGGAGTGGAAGTGAGHTGSAGSHGAGPNDVSSGCQAGVPAPSRDGAAALLAGLFVLRRRPRRGRPGY